MRLGSEELRDECLRRQSEDPDFQQRLKGLTIRLVMLGTDAPGNEDKQLAIDIENGLFTDVEVITKPAPSDLRSTPLDTAKYDFRVVAPQDVFIELIQGRLDLLTVMQKVKMEGDIAKLMIQMPGVIGFIEFLASMNIEP